MSEYMEIEAEVDEDDPRIIHFYTNLPLAPAGEAPQQYDSYEALEEGSALAQALTIVEGIDSLRIEGSDLAITRTDETADHALMADVSAVIKDFFL